MDRNLHIRESKEYNKKEYSILNHTGIDHAFNIYVANAHMLNKNASTSIFPANLYMSTIHQSITEDVNSLFV